MRNSILGVLFSALAAQAECNALNGFPKTTGLAETEFNYEPREKAVTALKGPYNFSNMSAGMAGVSSYSKIMNFDMASADFMGSPNSKFVTLESMVASGVFALNLWNTEPTVLAGMFDSKANNSYWSEPHGAYTRPKYNNYETTRKTGGYNVNEHNYPEVGAYVTEWAVYRAARPFHISMTPFGLGIDTVLYGFLPICGPSGDNLPITSSGSKMNYPGTFALCTVGQLDGMSCKDITPQWDVDGPGVANPYFALQQSCEGEADGTIVIHDTWGAFHAAGDPVTDKEAEASGDAGYFRPDGKGSYIPLIMAKLEYGDTIRILPSVGGWSLSQMFFKMGDDKIRQNFVNSAANLIKAWPFYDGVDIDWEFPGGKGADSGDNITITKAAISAADQVIPAYSTFGLEQGGECSQISWDESFGESKYKPVKDDYYSSYIGIGVCGLFSEDGVEDVEVVNVGCSKENKERACGMLQTRMKRKECKSCDGYISFNLFKDLRQALNDIGKPSERPCEWHGIGDNSNFVHKDWLISTAISGAPAKINQSNYGLLFEKGYLNKIMVMSYDFMGAWGKIGHQTNIFNNPDQALASESFSCHDAVQTLVWQGVPVDKIHLGVATYGRGWKGDFKSVSRGDDDQEYLKQIFNSTHDGACAGDIEDGVVDYHNMFEKVSTGAMDNVWDSCALADLQIGPDEIYTGDTPNSVFFKGAYVERYGLGGLFTWELAQDHSEWPLFNDMNEALGRGSSGGSDKHRDNNPLFSAEITGRDLLNPEVNSCARALDLKVMKPFAWGPGSYDGNIDNPGYDAEKQWCGEEEMIKHDWYLDVDGNDFYGEEPSEYCTFEGNDYFPSGSDEPYVFKNKPDGFDPGTYKNPANPGGYLNGGLGNDPKPPTDAPPTDAPPTDAPPTEAPPTEAPPVGDEFEELYFLWVKKCNLVYEVSDSAVQHCADGTTKAITQEETVEFCQSLWPYNITRCGEAGEECVWPTSCAEARKNFMNNNNNSSCDCGMTIEN